MKSLADDVLKSCESTREKVAAVRGQTTHMLSNFRQQMDNVHQELKEKSKNLKKFLGHTESSRLGDFKAFQENMRNEQKERSRQLADLLNGTRQELSSFRHEMENARAHWQKVCSQISGHRSTR